MRMRRSSASIPRSGPIPFVLPLLYPVLRSVVNSGDVQAALHRTQSGRTANDFDRTASRNGKGLFSKTAFKGSVLQFASSNPITYRIDGQAVIISDRLQYDIVAHPGKKVKDTKST